MDINMLLSTVILVSFIVTIVLAVGSYLAFKGRERRRPQTDVANANGEPVFFERIYVQAKQADKEDTENSESVTSGMAA